MTNDDTDKNAAPALDPVSAFNAVVELDQVTLSGVDVAKINIFCDYIVIALARITLAVERIGGDHPEIETIVKDTRAAVVDARRNSNEFIVGIAQRASRTAK